MEDKLRVLVVDDTAVYRRIVSEVLSTVPGVEVLGTAPNGRIALQKMEQLRPDLITLDLEMPDMDGLEVLRALRRQSSGAGVIMLSAFTSRDAQTTVSALELGAFDFVLKPTGNDPVVNRARLKFDLGAKIDAYARTRSIRRVLDGTAAVRSAKGADADVTVGLPQDRGFRGARSGDPPPALVRRQPVRAVVIGISTGGPRALNEMLPRLPADLAAPVLIVQHMPPIFTRSLAEDLDHRCKLRVSEAADGWPVAAGEILIAPGGRQMKVVQEDGQVRVRITDDPPENSCRPSVDYLFRSAAAVYGGSALAVIMTGMGNDGSRGCRQLKERGASVLAQDAASCVVFGMPREPIEQGTADAAVPLDRIAAEISRLTGSRSLACK